jgi:FkbM family methyltransferase
MNLKPLLRFFYARVPGVAAARFAIMDLTATYVAKPEYKGLLRLPVDDGLIIDVGASRGQSTAAFKRLAPRSSLVAFEPEPKSAARLAHRYSHDPTVTVHACALGERSGTIKFFVPTYGHWDCDGMAATDHRTATEWLTDRGRMYCFNEAKLSVREFRVDCRTLDEYGLAPSLIKLHAQGAELAILKGGRRTILAHKPPLMCAFPTTSVTKLLADWGYRPHTYENERFAPGVAGRPVTFTWYITSDQM